MKLKHASTHRNGRGIEVGVDFNTTFSLMATKKFKSNYPKYAALETILAAATWPNERVNEAYPEIPSTCSRCGLEPETDLHVFWQCPCNNNIDDDAIRDSDKYIDAAILHAEDKPCLWLRGIMPISYTHT